MELKTHYDLTKQYKNDRKNIRRMSIQDIEHRLLNFETDQLPSKYQIQIMMLNFLKYILDQK